MDAGDQEHPEDRFGAVASYSARARVSVAGSRSKSNRSTSASARTAASALPESRQNSSRPDQPRGRDSGRRADGAVKVEIRGSGALLLGITGRLSRRQNRRPRRSLTEHHQQNRSGHGPHVGHAHILRRQQRRK